MSLWEKFPFRKKGRVGGQEPAPARRGWVKNAAMAAAVATGGAVAVDTAGIGTERVDMRSWYEETIASERINYERYVEGQLNNPDGPMTVSSFEDYLRNIAFVPTEQEFEAVARIMDEYEQPVRLYSGTRLFTKLFQAAFATNDRTGHYRPEGIFFDQHGIYLQERVGPEGRRRLMTQENLDTIVAELAHAFQREKGTLSDARIIREVFDMILSGRTYDDLYDTPGTYEEEAHTRIEAMLRRQVTLYESEQTIRGHFPRFLEELGISVEGPLTEESFTYDAYVRLLDAVNRGINIPVIPPSERDTVAEEMLSLLELLDGYRCETRREDEAVPTLEIVASEQHYDALLEVLGVRLPSKAPITSRREVPPLASPQETLATWREARLAARQFEELNGPMLRIYLADAHILPQGERFDRDTYDRMMERLGQAYAFLRYSPGGQTNEGAALEALIRVANQICYFDPQCEGRYGILEHREEPTATMPSFRAEVVKGESHYRAFRRLLERYRDDEGTRRLTAP